MTVLFFIFILSCFYHYYIENVVVPINFLELRLEIDELADEVMKEKDNIPKTILPLMFEALLYTRVRLDSQLMNDLLLKFLPPLFSKKTKEKKAVPTTIGQEGQAKNASSSISAERTVFSNKYAEMFYNKLLKILSSGMLANMMGWYIFLWMISIIIYPFIKIFPVIRRARAKMISAIINFQNKLSAVMLAQID